MNVMIYDNFLPFPVQVRAWALDQVYMNSQDYTVKYGQFTDWPGLRTDGVIDLDPHYANTVFSMVANIIQRNQLLAEISIKSYFQITRSQDGYSWVHQDNDVKYAALLYLNPDADPFYGTTLYRCNDAAKWESYMTNQQGYETMKKINEEEETVLYRKLFTPVDNIGNVFNRLLIYKGDLYHKSTSYFGDDIKTGRLTQVFFING